MISFLAKSRQFAVASLAVVAVSCAFSSSLQADPLREVADRNSNFSVEIPRFLNAWHRIPTSLEGGVRINIAADGSRSNNGVFAVRLAAANANLANAGSATFLAFDAAYDAQMGGFRIRFTAAEFEVAYFCNGGPVMAGAGFFSQCRAIQAIGLGATLGRVSHDVITQRIAARWAEMSAVLNLLALARGSDGSLLGNHLRTRILAQAGASVDTVWDGNTPGAVVGAQNTYGRFNFAISGVFLSSDNNWEVRAYAGFRPQMTEWSNYQAEARLSVLYHLMVSHRFMMNFGVTAGYEYNTHPAQTAGLGLDPFTSDRDPHNVYLGVLFQIPTLF
jgi:hypothetical protein